MIIKTNFLFLSVPHLLPTLVLSPEGDKDGKTGGKQYRVELGKKIRIEKLDVDVGKKVTFDKVLLKADAHKVSVGTPYVKGAAVEANVLKSGKGDKKIVFRYHSKTRYRKKKGHRQQFTEIEVGKIV